LKKMSAEKQVRGPWLHAWYDPLAGIKTVTPLVRLGDLNSDGDNKLLICDIDKKLKVYKGTGLIVEHALLDYPVSMCVTYTENQTPQIPSVAVAAGSHIFIYRHLRPYRKWNCPPIDISEVESNIWDDLRSNKISPSEAVSMLSSARDTGCNLSAHSLDLILIDSESKRAEYVNEMKSLQLQQQTLITCMEVLKKDSEEPDSVSLLVVGTESGAVYILPPDPAGSAYVCKIQLQSTPVMMNVSGLFDTEWRVIVACRDGRVYNIKEGDVRGTAVLTGNIIDAGSQIVCIARQDKLVWVATMDRMISCYTIRGKRTTGLQILDDDVTDMCVMPIKRMQLSHALLVVLASGEIRMYNENKILHKFSVEKPVMAIRFGVYGREDNTLAIIHGKGGAITIKIMRRSMDMESNGGLTSGATGPPPEQDIPLQIPKKTKLFVEQTQRERDQSTEIHKAFQRDLCKMRLETARAYVKTLTTDGLSPLGPGGGSSQDIRIHAQVKGLGPRFLLCIFLQNVGQNPVLGTRLHFSFDTNLYTLGYNEPSNAQWSKHRQVINVPILLPGPKQCAEAEILSIDPQGRAGQVLILLGTSSSSVPVIAATVRMPVSEPNISF